MKRIRDYYKPWRVPKKKKKAHESGIGEYVSGRPTSSADYENPYDDVMSYIDSLRRKSGAKSTRPQKYDDKKEILRDARNAESMLRRGITIGGKDIEDAVHLYNFAIEDAKSLGDYDLARQIYERGKTTLKKGYKYTKSVAKNRDDSFLGENPRIKLGKLERGLELLKDPKKEGRERIADMTFAIIFFLISITGSIMSFSGITGAAIGGGSENIYGLIVFLSLLIAIYFFYRKNILP